MRNVLEEIVAHKRQELVELKQALPQSVLAQQIVPGDGSFIKALTGSRLEDPPNSNDIKIIAEVKPKSPSKGLLRQELDLDAILQAYGQKASAISVLTDMKYFGGSFELLEQVSTKTKLPCLCKDFIIDTWQIYRARRSGAQAILLIAKALTKDELCRLYALALELNMAPVLEVQNEEEVEVINSLRVGNNPKIVLVNNRNLVSLDVDLDTSLKLANLIDKAAIKISASGIENGADIQRLVKGYKVFLVGSSLMQASNITQALDDLLQAGNSRIAQEELK